MKCAKIPPWVKNPIGGRIEGANDARLPIPWQVLITNVLKGEKKRSDFCIESTNSQCVNAPSDLSTTPLRYWGFQQCLPFSFGGKHCQHTIAVMGNANWSLI